jgi:predicted nuclease with TOPRIM domain
MDEPDQYDRATICEQMRGFKFHLMKLAAEYDSQYQIIKALEKRITALEADRAVIGELRGQLAELEEWKTKLTSHLKTRFDELKKGNGKP